MTQSARQFDAIVVGGGLAGSCAAFHLARRGVRVAVLESGNFPRHKVCGEFLSPESRIIFRRLGIEDKLTDAGARSITVARLFVPDGRFVEVPLAVPALAISRYVLDAILWDNAREAGAEGFEKTRVRTIESNGFFSVQTTRGDFRAVSIIEARGRTASGAGSDDTAPSRFFGLKIHWRGARLETGVTELHVFQGGYCGLVRVEGDLTNICLLARYEVWQQSGAKTPDELFRWVLTQCPALAERVVVGEAAMPWLATGNVSFAESAPVLDGILRCGDAAGFIHPLTGDGMAMALRSGELAAATLAAQLRDGLRTSDAIAIYDAAWRRELKPRLGWAQTLAPLFLHPVPARAALPLAKAFPATARFLLNKTRG